MKKEMLETWMKEAADRLAYDIFVTRGFGKQDYVKELVGRIKGIDEHFLDLRSKVMDYRTGAPLAASPGRAIVIERILHDLDTYAMVLEITKLDRVEVLEEGLSSKAGS